MKMWWLGGCVAGFFVEGPWRWEASWIFDSVGTVFQ